MNNQACTAKPIVPHSERPRRVWVLAKRTGYLPYDNKGSGWTYDMLEKVSRELNVEFVGAYEREHVSTCGRCSSRPRSDDPCRRRTVLGSTRYVTIFLYYLCY